MFVLIMVEDETVSPISVCIFHLQQWIC